MQAVFESRLVQLATPITLVTVLRIIVRKKPRSTVSPGWDAHLLASRVVQKGLRRIDVNPETKLLNLARFRTGKSDF